MTKEPNHTEKYETCSLCFYMYYEDEDKYFGYGFCQNKESDHFQHCLRKNHPACKSIKKEREII